MHKENDQLVEQVLKLTQRVKALDTTIRVLVNLSAGARHSLGEMVAENLNADGGPNLSPATRKGIDGENFLTHSIAYGLSKLLEQPVDEEKYTIDMDGVAKENSIMGDTEILKLFKQAEGDLEKSGKCAAAAAGLAILEELESSMSVTH